MELKLFFTYIGSLLAFSIALTILVKSLSRGFKSQGKKPIIYGSFSAILASLGAYLTIFLNENLFTVFWIFVAIFMIFGIVHLKLVQEKYFYSSNENKGKILAAEIFYSISIVLFVIVVFSSLQYFITNDKSFIFYPMMLSTLAFFIPMLVMKTFDSAYNIPATEYSTWEYPINNPIPLPMEDQREKLLVIGFEIAKRSHDIKKTDFRAKAPESIRLGELFYHFINDYNEVQSETPIEFADNGNAPHEWWFRLKRKWYQKNWVLDPVLRVNDNGIKENSVIICERVNQ